MPAAPQHEKEFFRRQAQKRHLAHVWATLADLRPGMTILDIGSGPGFLAAIYATLTGPTGTVYALDPNIPPAEPAQNLIHLPQHAETPITLPKKPDIVFLTDTLHHAKNPEKILAAIHATAPAKLFIAEYDPDQPGRLGAKPHRRLPPATAIALLQATGFTLLAHHPAPDEHYALLAVPTA